VSQAATSVDLTNCDKEPIHIPGSVQPHGAMLAFTPDGRLVAQSANAELVLGGEIPQLGQHFSMGQLNPETVAAIEHLLTDPGSHLEPVELALDSRVVDAISHKSGDWALIEFEPHASDAPKLHTFAFESQHSLSMIQSARSVEDLLAKATAEVRRLTGFDRVMCYRFRHDDSGDVVHEDKREDLEPFLGLRYPTSDIPAQARRLYVLSTLRFIADVDALPSPLIPPLGPDAAKPLDLSQAVLRSVSPIHLEYLRNMGVTASMSVSIVVGGRLWGLFACHHYSGPRTVPHAVRIACKLLSQMVSMNIERFDARARMDYVEASRSRREQLLEQVRNGSDLLDSLSLGTALRDLVPCDGVAVTQAGRQVSMGASLSSEVLKPWLECLRETRDEVVASHSLGDSYPSVGEFKDIAGALAVRFDRENDGWVIWFRKEEIETVRWAGNPDKEYVEGPHGPRLSPRGSFKEYRSQVRGLAKPWDSAEIETASHFRVGLQDIAFARMGELVRAREVLMATLGHDLRSPLYAINMSAYLISEDNPGAGELSTNIAIYSNRMKRLIDHMLDFSRIQSGISLGVTPTATDAKAVVQQILAETEAAYPGFQVEASYEVTGPAWVDTDRFAQVLTNLLGNAKSHGEPGHPALLKLTGGGDAPLAVTVENDAPEIPEELRSKLFRPFKGNNAGADRNPKGLGLGLFIVNQILDEHGGSVRLNPYLNGRVSFTVEFPPRSS
jgi:light-regulated signal transduction histidine kinase (bacteriophytochrome)